MPDPSDLVHEQNPADILAETIVDRLGELEFLVTSLREAIEVESNLDSVNEVIANSARPDLVITERAEMMKLDSLKDLNRINNFVPHMTGFGPRVYEVQEPDSAGESKSEWVGRRQPTEEELETYFFIGARGTYEAYEAFLETNGLDARQVLNEEVPQTHIAKESFMRMWILFPELTRYLMASCLDDVGNRHRGLRGIEEEIFVAYNIMCRLVDTSDRYIIRNGEVDDWSLCR